MNRNSTRRIAKHLGLSHNQVLSDTRTTLKALGLNPLDYRRFYLNDDGRQTSEYVLNDREFSILMCGYSLEYRASIVDIILEP